MEAFKYAIFAFEPEGLVEDLKVVDAVCAEFKKQPKSASASVQVVKSVDAAGPVIDAFKAKTCGSAYNVALLNLNQFPSAPELEFLLSVPVLGDPRSVFLVSLRSIQAPIYSVARVKVEREALKIAQGTLVGAPSCIDTYTAANRAETATRVAQILNAYLEEEDMREKAKLTGMVLPSALSPATELMQRATTIFFGRRSGKTSAIMRPVSKIMANDSRPEGGSSSSGRYGPSKP
jgi:hypothetical protein